MALTVHLGERADRLVDGLGDLLATPLPDPFAQELVLVPERGVERWLSQRLSHRLGPSAGGDDGVCAGVEFRSPRSLVAEVLGATDEDPWAPDTLVWPLLAVIDAGLGEPWCATLAAHLGHGRPGEEGDLRRGRRYAVARRLAQLFAAYAVQRPTLLADWESGRVSDGAGGDLDPDLQWQPELWRRLVAAVGAPSPVRRHADAVAGLVEDPAVSVLPPRLSLFGPTRIPVTEARLLAALGVHRDVHLWLPHPSPTLWSALADLRGAVVRREDTSQRRVHHPLLASLGRDVRELERTLLDAGALTVPPASPGRAPVSPVPDTLLGWLQSDVTTDTRPDASQRDARVLRPSDRSVQVHSCHGPARQVEVLREVVLGLLADDPSLEPRDVLVMCPDIEAFAPLVEAAFGLGESVAGGHPGQRLQVRLADRALTQTNPLLSVAGRLLDLAGGRAEASEVLDLLHAEPVRHRFRFTDADLETIVGWVGRAGVRWAYDAAHRAPYSLEGYVQNTWRSGLDRVLAGVAVSDDAERWIGTTLPLDDVGSGAIDLAGRLAEALDRLQRTTDRLTGTHPAGHWLDALRRGIDELTSVPPSQEWQTGQVHRELAGLTDDAREGPLELRLPDVRALLDERLGGRPTRANFRTGTLTVATLVPMRSVPHRVVCLLGLDDGTFPRAPGVDGDDVLARRPLTGERDPRSEDRQLMLDAVLAAREHLVVTYSGAAETTGQPRPPAVPLGELFDALDATVDGGRDHAVRRHPLQDFDPRNLRAGDLRLQGPFSFDTAALAGARAAARDRVAPPALAATVLPTRPRTDVELASLVTFFRHPVRAFLRERLEVRLLDEGEDVADALPVELDGLQKWQVGERLLGDLRRGRTPQDSLGAEWRRGELPPGQLGWRLGKTLARQAEPVAEQFEAVTQGRPARSVDVDVDLGGGRRLRGTVGGLYADRLVVTTFSRLGPRQWLEAWIPLLALCAAHPARPWSAGAIGRGPKGYSGQPEQPTARIAFASVADPVPLLRDLVAMRDTGLTEPLPLPLRTGFAWAENWRPGVEARARARAAQKWESDRFDGEDADDAHVAVWGPGAPLDVLLGTPRPGEQVEAQPTRLGALSARLWAPMLAAVVR